ncbi:guanylin-like [Tiliqua scincoides]|uniref:guanylin-like n=1 Tax=Tiliqua scincoides TaxID=71010 RepID=UPI003462C240
MVTFLAPMMLMLLVAAHSCHAQGPVQVTDNEISVPLEFLKKLKDHLGKSSRSAFPHLSWKAVFIGLCSDSELPEDCKVICEMDDGIHILQRLDQAVEDVDECEICVVPACTGCY